MKMSNEKRNFSMNKSLACARSCRFAIGFCFIFALVIGSHLFNCAPAKAQLVFGGGSQPSVGSTDASGKIWSSMSQAALKTEAILRQPIPSALRNADDFSDAMDVLHGLGLDTVLTASAQDDALMEDERWEVIGNPNEIGVALSRYLESQNAVYAVTSKGVLRFISLDEMSDPKHFQTVVYRVDHLARDARELTALARQIQDSLVVDEWQWGGGQATMKPRLQSGRRLLIVSIHYQNHAKLRQLLYELAVSTNGSPAYRSRSTVVGTGVTRSSTSRVVEVPGATSRRRKTDRRSMTLGLRRPMPPGGVF